MITFEDECGLFGLFGASPADRLTRQALSALHHRGRLGGAVISSDGHLLRTHPLDGTAPTLDLRVSSRPAVLAIGEVWNDTHPRPSRPQLARYHAGQLALSMTGRFTNASELRARLKSEGALFSTVNDAEILLHLVARSRQKTLVNRVVDALQQVEGGYALLLASEDRLIAVRDPRGVRSLWVGDVEGAPAFASDPTPFASIDGSAHRALEPGEVLVADAEGVVSLQPFRREAHRPCVWEPLTLLPSGAERVYTTRIALGERLARLQPCTGATVVVSPPGPATAIALGYARGIERPWVEGLLPHPDTHWQALGSVLRDQHVVLVLTGLVNADLAQEAIRCLRNAGAAEVHVRVATPVTRATCLYGVLSDPPSFPHGGSASTIAERLGADSAGTLSLTALEAAVTASAQLAPGAVCAGCLGGDWPVVSTDEGADQLPLFEGPTG